MHVHVRHLAQAIFVSCGDQPPGWVHPSSSSNSPPAMPGRGRGRGRGKHRAAAIITSPQNTQALISFLRQTSNMQLVISWPQIKP